MKKGKKKIVLSLIGGICLLIGIVAGYLLAPVSKSDKPAYIYINADDNLDNVCQKLDEVASGRASMVVKLLSGVTGYGSHIRSGRYEISEGMGAIQLFRNLRNGHQEPVRLTIRSVRTKEKLAESLAENLMLKKDSILAALNDEAVCKAFGLNTNTIVSMFIPNTYEVYWDIKLDKFLQRMKRESDAFWDADRMEKANQLGMTPVQVITLASIIDEETANSDEKPRVAGMYYNRLQKNMPLQADPTIKFAMQQFQLHRIYRNMLDVESPYNTYRNVGLPPGPIRIPSVDGIEAVLILEHHDYLYMCAKEDFSGTHNFAVTYAEHLKNAAKYSKALDARGVK